MLLFAVILLAWLGTGLSVLALSRVAACADRGLIADPAPVRLQTTGTAIEHT